MGWFGSIFTDPFSRWGNDPDDDRIFHLHDDPKDCDDPEIHFGPGSGLTGDEEKE